MDTKQPGLNIDLARMREAALHAQVQGYVFKSDGSQVRQVLDYLHERTLEIESQHARIAELEALAAGYAAARLEIASLRAQESAIGAGGVEPLRKRECLHQIGEPSVAQAPVASIYITNDGQREFDDWRAPLPVGRNELFAAPQPAAQALDAAFEAVRLLLCGLERYSFVLDDDGVVRRVRDRVGNWIEFDAAHELFDPAAVDAAIAAKQGGANG